MPAAPAATPSAVASAVTRSPIRHGTAGRGSSTPDAARQRAAPAATAHAGHHGAIPATGASDSAAYSLALQTDGSLVTAGMGFVGTTRNMALVRFFGDPPDTSISSTPPTSIRKCLSRWQIDGMGCRKKCRDA